jgi:Lrp/AsnC family leucine-responsive transcriptional regulator
MVQASRKFNGDCRTSFGLLEELRPQSRDAATMADFDDTDLTLIELLQKDARTPQAQLAATVGLAASSVNERIRKLGERGLIAGFHARISPEVMGYDLLAFLYVAWSRPETERAFL